MHKRWGIGLALIGLGILLVVLWRAWQSTPTTPGILEVNGRVEGDQAAVGARVGGKIVRLVIREGDRLAAGALIAELASDQVQAQLEQAEHALHAAREHIAAAQARVVSTQRQIDAARTAVALAERESQAQIGEAQAALGAAQARLQQAEADLEKAAKDYERYQGLFAKQVVSAQQLDAAQAADAVARAAVEATRKQRIQAEKSLDLAQASQVNVEFRRKEVQTLMGHLAEAQAAVATAQAQFQTTEASVKLARANRDDTRVLAPFAGTVLRKLVETGEVITAGTPLITLVDLSQLHAKVYVAEADLGKVKVGDPARVYTDTFPARYFVATVAQVAQQAEFTPRDIHMQDERVKLVFAVKLAINNPQGILKPGMPVEARIRWDPRGFLGR
jgi:HlyD family secretion protein